MKPSGAFLFHRVRVEAAQRVPLLGGVFGGDLLAIGTSAALLRLITRMP
jgi:hypothetical protein